jgi:hypothetical protein
MFNLKSKSKAKISNDRDKLSFIIFDFRNFNTIYDYIEIYYDQFLNSKVFHSEKGRNLTKGREKYKNTKNILFSDADIKAIVKVGLALKVVQSIRDNGYYQDKEYIYESLIQEAYKKLDVISDEPTEYAKIALSPLIKIRKIIEFEAKKIIRSMNSKNDKMCYIINKIGYEDIVSDAFIEVLKMFLLLNINENPIPYLMNGIKKTIYFKLNSTKVDVDFTNIDGDGDSESGESNYVMDYIERNQKLIVDENTIIDSCCTSNVAIPSRTFKNYMMFIVYPYFLYKKKTSVDFNNKDFDYIVNLTQSFKKSMRAKFPKLCKTLDVMFQTNICEVIDFKYSFESIDGRQVLNSYLKAVSDEIKYDLIEEYNVFIQYVKKRG